MPDEPLLVPDDNPAAEDPSESESGSADTPTTGYTGSEADLDGSEASSSPSVGSDLDPDLLDEVPEEHLLHFECPEWTRSVV